MVFERLRSRLAGSRWSEFVALVAAGTFCGCCWVFFTIAASLTTYQAAEENILRAFRRAGDPAQLVGPAWLEWVARDVTSLGSTTVLTLLTILVLAFLLITHRRRKALLVVIAVVGGTILSTSLKLLFARERPSVVPHLTTFGDASFPSGHAMLSSIVYLTLGVLLARAAERRREHLFFIFAALLLSGLVGVSRMALGVHYPTDVLAGWSAGITWGLLCWTAAWWWRGAKDAAEQ